MTYQVLLHRYVNDQHESKYFPITDQPDRGWYSSKQKAEFAYNNGNLIETVEGLSPSNTADVNTASLQAALASGGVININEPGVYEIDEALIIGSNTWITLSRGVEIKLKTGSDDNLLRTASRDATPLSVSSLTYDAATHLVTANTASAHGYTSGDYICILDVETRGYGGVHRITVVDADTFTYIVPKHITSPCAGTIVCVPVTRNVVIEGGRWNHNDEGTGSTVRTNGFIIGPAFDFHMRDTFHKDSPKYCIYGYGLRSCSFTGQEYDSTSDGIHLYGPLRGVQVERQRGRCEDDCVIIMSYESPDFAYQDLSRGDISNITVRDVDVDTGSNQCVTCYTPHTYPFEFDNILIEQVSTDDAQAVNILGLNGVDAADHKPAGNIIVRNISSSGSRLLNVTNGTKIHSLTVDGAVFHARNFGNDYQGISLGECEIDNVRLRGILTPDGTFTPTTNSYLLKTGTTTTINLLAFNDCTLYAENSSVRFCQFKGTIKQILLENVFMDKGAMFCSFELTNTDCVVSLQNFYSKSDYYGLSLSQDCSIVYNNVRQDEAGSDEMFRVNSGKTVAISGSGAAMGANKLINNLGGTVSLTAPDAQIDIDECSVSVAGQLFYNTDSTNIAAGLVTSNGTSWIHLATGATWTP